MGTYEKKAFGKDKQRLSRRSVAPGYGVDAFVLALGLTGFAFLLYLRTLAPGVLYYERPDLIDAAMLQVHPYVLGITHPTGYPLWTMLVHLFTYLPFGDPAYRTSLASAVFGAATVSPLFFAALRMSGRLWAAAVGSLAFAVGNTFWGQAVIPEVYTLNAFFVSLIVLVLLVWRDTRENRYLLAVALLMGLSLTNHVTSGLLLPAAALFIFMVDRQKLLDRWLVLKGATLFFLGLLPYLYLPVRALTGPPFYEGDPGSFAGFLDLVLSRELGIGFGTIGWDVVFSRIADLPGYLLDEFHFGLLLVAATGIIVVFRKDRAAALLLGIPCLGWLVYAIDYDIFDYFIYFIPSYLMLALFIASGTGAILDRAERFVARHSLLLRRAVPVLISIPLLYLALADVGEDYPRLDYSQDLEGRRIVEAVAEQTAPDATVLHHRSPLPYMILVENRRADLTLLSPWYPSRNPMRVWSASSAPTDEYPEQEDIGSRGVADARVAAGKGPVYVLEGSTDLCAFQNAGFSVLEVEPDVLYELVPPGGTPYTGSEARQWVASETGNGITADEPPTCISRAGSA